MTSVNFYHLKTSNIYVALTKLLEKALLQKQNILVRTDSLIITNEIDEVLWSYDLSSFVPHNKLGDQDSNMSPIFITHEKKNLNNAELLFILSTPKFSIEEFLIFKRTFILFNDDDLEFLQSIERVWLELENFELERSYWIQERTGWKPKTFK